MWLRCARDSVMGIKSVVDRWGGRSVGLSHVVKSRLVVDGVSMYRMMWRRRGFGRRRWHCIVVFIIVVSTTFVGEICRTFVFMRNAGIVVAV